VPIQPIKNPFTEIEQDNHELVIEMEEMQRELERLREQTRNRKQKAKKKEQNLKSEVAVALFLTALPNDLLRDLFRQLIQNPKDKNQRGVLSDALKEHGL